MNQEDGGNRRFICVQLPEPLTPPKELEDGTLLSNVSDIGKERIRRVIRRIQRQDDVQCPLDLNEDYNQFGFKVFKLSDSHYRCWQGSTEKDLIRISKKYLF